MNQRKNLNNKNKQFKKSFLEQMEEKDFQKIIDEKDQIIRKLQFKLEKLQRQKQQLINTNSGQGSTNNFYKQKLQQQIKENQKAIDLFISISHRMMKLIQMLRVTNQFNDDSSQVKNLLGLMGSGHDSGIKFQNMSLDESQAQNMQTIQTQVNKRFDELQSTCDLLHKTFIKTQKDVKGFQKRLKDTKVQFDDELRTVSKELKQARLGKQHLKNLLEKNQEQKNDILSRIANIMDPKTRKQVDMMGREDLLQFAKKLMFKITQLESAKNQVIKENKKIKTADLEKYKKILNEVKEVKEMSRLGKSMV